MKATGKDSRLQDKRERAERRAAKKTASDYNDTEFYDDAEGPAQSIDPAVLKAFGKRVIINPTQSTLDAVAQLDPEDGETEIRFSPRDLDDKTRALRLLEAGCLQEGTIPFNKRIIINPSQETLEKIDELIQAVHMDDKTELWFSRENEGR